mmetsp:Transcript_18901/g.43829  ORF Transcript_18901/g.43829 Transcript_18901/m.43829 type:complete len:316 (-) Transcript_18901:341-1288(-)
MAHREHRKPLVLASSLVAGGGANDSATEQVPTTPVASLHRNHWLCIQLEIRTYPLFSLLVLYGADEASVIRTTSHPFQLGERVRSPAMSHRTRASTLGLWRKHSSPVTHWSSHTYVIIDGTGAPAAQRIGLPRSVMPRRSPVFFATRVTPPLGWSAPLHGTMDHSRSSRSAVAAASTGRSSSSSSPSSSSSSGSRSWVVSSAAAAASSVPSSPSPRSPGTSSSVGALSGFRCCCCCCCCGGVMHAAIRPRSLESELTRDRMPPNLWWWRVTARESAFSSFLMSSLRGTSEKAIDHSSCSVRFFRPSNRPFLVPHR